MELSVRTRPLMTTTKTTVLIVDDNPLVLRLARLILAKDPVDVMVASNWIELTSQIALTFPDIIFLDVNLPRLSGDEISAILKSHKVTKEVPIILISDLPEERLQQILPYSGASGYLRKPLTRDKLIDAIRQFVGLPNENSAEKTIT